MPAYAEMPDPSPAAKSYADSLYYRAVPPREIAALAFDAGHAAALATVAPVQPRVLTSGRLLVRLTDPNDPRSVDDQLASLRAAGYDVVKRES